MLKSMRKVYILPQVFGVVEGSHTVFSGQSESHCAKRIHQIKNALQVFQ